MTNITATLDGASVTIVNIVPNGNDTYIVYKDASDVLKVTKKVTFGGGVTTSAVELATSATVN